MTLPSGPGEPQRAWTLRRRDPCPRPSSFPRPPPAALPDLAHLPWTRPRPHPVCGLPRQDLEPPPLLNVSFRVFRSRRRGPHLGASRDPGSCSDHLRPAPDLSWTPPTCPPSCLNKSVHRPLSRPWTPRIAASGTLIRTEHTSPSPFRTHTSYPVVRLGPFPIFLPSLSGPPDAPPRGSLDPPVFLLPISLQVQHVSSSSLGHSCHIPPRGSDPLQKVPPSGTPGKSPGV